MKIADVLFRVEANEALGLGHLVRCRSLALALRALGADRIVVSCSRPDLVGKVWGTAASQMVSPAELDRIGRFSWAVADVPGSRRPEWKKLGETADRVAIIDDEGSGPFPAQVLLRPNLLGLPRPKALPPEAAYWTGGDYVILDPAYERARPDAASSTPPRVVVCFGGSDPGGFTVRLLPLLNSLVPTFEVHVVLGAAFPDPDAVILAARPGVRVDHGLPTLASTLAGAAAAVVSGGTLLYEACALGVPSLVVCQNDGQEREARIFAREGAAVNLGPGGAVPPHALTSAVREFLHDGPRRERLSAASRRLVSRDGSRRIAAALFGLAGETRTA